MRNEAVTFLKVLMRIILLLISLQCLASENWTKQHTNGEISAFLTEINKECPDISRVYLLDDEGDQRTTGGNNLTVIVFGRDVFSETPGETFGEIRFIFRHSRVQVYRKHAWK